MGLDLLLPRRCVVCRGAGAQLCAPCRDRLPRLTPPLCERCGAPTAWPVPRCRECSGRRIAFAGARAAVAYSDDVRRFVQLWKERGLRHLSEEAAALIVDRVPRPAADVVTFVPADAWRARSRGHHPAERLARELAEHWSLPCERLLVRTGATRRQRGLDLAARRLNVRGAFHADADGRAVVLVDDVYTTGATADAAARALGGYVAVVTFARATRGSR